MDKKIKADFIPRARQESAAQQLLGQLLGGELDANTARGAQFFNPPSDAPAVAPEKALATGVLKQAAHDLRRFNAATTGVERELYLDAYSWITANDFSWPYSFLNVCKLLHVCPEVVRTEVLADASLGWFGYWIRRGGRVSRALRASFVHAFTTSHSKNSAESGDSAYAFQ